MKMKSASVFTVLALLALSTINSQLSTAHAQTPAGTVFTYDGKLQYGGSPVADGLYDFQFNLSNAPTGGSQVGSTLPKTAVPVTNGLFTTTLDFGAVFTGNATWLAISVCSNGVGSFQNLAPLQELTPTPYAVFAESGNAAGLNGTIPAANFGGTYGNVITLNNPGNSISGNGSGLTSLNAAQLTGLLGNAQLANNSITINPGTGLSGGGVAALGGSLTLSTAAGALTTPISIPGTAQTAVPNTSYAATSASLTTINLPTTANMGDVVEVNGTGAGGWQVSGSIDGTQGFIWTLQANAPSGNWQSVASSSDGTHLVAVLFNVISGWIYTSADSGVTWTLANAPIEEWQSVASSADGTHLVAVVFGGRIYTSTDSGVTWTPQANAPVEEWQSIASSSDGSHLVAVASGGGGFYTSADSGVTSTPQANATNENWKSVVSSSDGSHLVAVVFGGGIYTSADSGVTWTSQANAPVEDWNSVASSSDGSHLVAVPEDGGIYTSADSGVTWAPQVTAPTENWNSVASSSDGSHLVGVISGGGIYTAVVTPGTVAGSLGSSEKFEYIGGGVWEPVQANGTGSITINTGTGLIGGGTVALGGSLTLSATGAGSGIISVMGNSDITATTVAGSVTLNDNSTSISTPGTIVRRDGTGSFSAGTITLGGSLILPAIANGGRDAILSGSSSPAPLLLNDFFGNICVGLSAGGKLSTTTQPGDNTALGVGALFDNFLSGYNTAIGYEALSNSTAGMNTGVGFMALSANKTGSGNIALGAAAGIAIASGNNNIDIGNQGIAGDNGIIRIGTQGTQTACFVAGNVYANGVMLTSDRNAKENFSTINALAVLAKVASLPVTEWNYKTDEKGVQHIGPMAQDFQAVFQLSKDDKHISVVDEGGVALAAIQGLNQKLEQQGKDKDAEIQDLKQQNDSLAARLNELESAVKQLATQK